MAGLLPGHFLSPMTKRYSAACLVALECADTK